MDRNFLCCSPILGFFQCRHMVFKILQKMTKPPLQHDRDDCTSLWLSRRLYKPLRMESPGSFSMALEGRGRGNCPEAQLS